MIRLKRHIHSIWYRVVVQYEKQGCRLSFPVFARSLESAQLKTLHRHLHHRDVSVLSTSKAH